MQQVPADLAYFFATAKSSTVWSEWKDIFKNAKKLLNLLRYTKLTDYQAQFSYKLHYDYYYDFDVNTAAEEARTSAANKAVWTYSKQTEFYNLFPFNKNNIGMQLPGTFLRIQNLAR